VLDEVATSMWQQLLLAPDDRDITALARRFSAPTTVVAADMVMFADKQRADRHLTLVPGSPTALGSPMRLRLPSIANAWRERAWATRDLRRSFTSAYHDRTGPTAAAVNPARRPPVDRVVATFATAENWYFSRQAPRDCLPRSLSLLRVLRAAGWPAEHVIGVAMYPFQAHAWVELSGKPIREGVTFLDRFTAIQRA
jgi:hypothetical protein